MCEALGLELLALERVRVGDVELGDLRKGRLRRLERKEVASLRRVVEGPISGRETARHAEDSGKRARS